MLRGDVLNVALFYEKGEQSSFYKDDGCVMYMFNSILNWVLVLAAGCGELWRILRAEYETMCDVANGSVRKKTVIVESTEMFKFL